MPENENSSIDRRRAHVDLATRLQKAIANHDLTLLYQPIHDINSGRVLSTEALMRWTRKSRQQSSIEALADAAERGDAAFDLAEWVARRGHEDAAIWRESDPQVRLNLNVSARYLGERDLDTFVEQLTARGMMDPTRVNLEITEKSFVRRPAAVTEMLTKVRKRGAQLWLDDFGTGHSSIEHLRFFPIDGVKIPSLYTRDLVTNRRSLAIARGIIKLAKELELQVVAEGVETEEQLQILRSMGCDEIQGFVFSKAMPATEVVKLLTAQKNGDPKRMVDGASRLPLEVAEFEGSEKEHREQQ